MSERDAFSRYRLRLEALGFRPSRRLGQNFLLDPSLHRFIVDTARPEPVDLVLEVGVGLGFLTRELVRRAGHVVGVEVDARLLEVLRDELAQLPERQRVHLLGVDVLGGPSGIHPRVVEALAAARAQCPGGFLVVANLPYAISGPFLAELCVLDRLPDRIVVLVQRDLAERIAASPGTKEYGGLAALVQALYVPRRVRDVPREVFRPRPRVVSAILALERAASGVAAGWSADRRREFRRFLQALFGQRRKTLRRTLPAAAAAVGRDDPGGWPEEQRARRAEELDPAALGALWERMEKFTRRDSP